MKPSKKLKQVFSSNAILNAHFNVFYSSCLNSDTIDKEYLKSLISMLAIYYDDMLNLYEPL